MTMFNKTVYIDRREKLTQSVPSGLLLFLGNQLSSINFKDNTYYFRQDSTFLYYFGISKPDIAAIIDLDSGTTTLFGNELTIDEIIWTGELETFKEQGLQSGVEHIKPYHELKSTLEEGIRKGRKIHFLPPYRPENSLLLADVLSQSVKEIQNSTSEEFIKAVVAQRSIKSAEEIIEIEKAVNTSIDMHFLAMKMAKPGITELNLASAIQELASNAGGNLAYQTIMTINGHILHNHDYSHTLKEGQLILNDSGAETAMGYAGDLTRTFPVGKKFTSIQKDLYNIVLNSFHDASRLLKASERYMNVHLQASKTLVEGLKGMGLMKGDADEAVAAGAHTLFFQCGTGHMMGLDVHDMEDLGEQYVGYTPTEKKNTQEFGLKSLRLGKALEPGFVVTVEPGIYFIPTLIDLWKSEKKHSAFINYEKVEEFRNFRGIRIEDDFLITKEGHRVLGKPLAKTVEEIENIRTEAF